MREPIVPSKLYKYQSCNDYALINLKQRVLWFSRFQEFNDPFDCDINFSITDVTEENLNKMLADLRKSEGDASFPNSDKFKENVINSAHLSTELIKTFYWKDIGVACFSEINDSILMWSHYANSHKGFCMEFDTQFYPFKQDGGDFLYKVDYPESNLYPPLSLSDILQEKLPRLSRIILTTKSWHWSYEKEWRILFGLAGGRAYPFDVAGLTAIYFGCRIDSEHKKFITSLASDLPIRLIQMQRSKHGFEILPEES